MTPPSHDATTLSAQNLRLGYDSRVIVDDLTVTIPPRKVTVIVGANAFGTSTLPPGTARPLKPRAGSVVVDGTDMHSLPTRPVATRLALPPPQATSHEGVRKRGA